MSQKQIYGNKRVQGINSFHQATSPRGEGDKGDWVIEQLFSDSLS